MTRESSLTRRRGMVFQWRIPLRSRFPAPELLLTGPVERGLIGLNGTEWPVRVCPDLKCDIPVEKVIGEEFFMDSERFAKEFVEESVLLSEERAKQLAQDETPLERDALIQSLLTRAWREFNLGVLPAARQMAQMGRDHLDLKLLLTKQAAEEYLHSRIFLERAQELGASGNLTDFQPTEEDWDHPYEIAASLQCTGEVLLVTVLKHMMKTTDPITARLIKEQVLIHEGAHIQTGRKILERFAVTEEIQARVRAIREEKYVLKERIVIA